MPFRLSADPVVSTFAINRFNDGIDNFFRKFMQILFGSVIFSCLKIVIELKSSLLKTIVSSARNVMMSKLLGIFYMLESSKFDCPILTKHNFIPCQRNLITFPENYHNVSF